MSMIREEINGSRYPIKATANIEYYVATDGNDSNPGTETEPFATIQYAIDLIPKILNGYYAEIILKDGTYAEGNIRIERFINGEIFFYSDSMNADLVFIEAPVGEYYGFRLIGNGAYVYFADISVKIQRDFGACIRCDNSFHVDIEDIKVGDNGNSNTVGIRSDGSFVDLGTVADIDANKVSVGINARYGGRIALFTADTFGDTFLSTAVGGLVHDGIRLIKADYDDAITKKHTQNTDTDLDAAFKATLAKTTIDEIIQAASDTLTVIEVKGTIITNYGQGAANNLQELPTAAKGMSFVAICGTAQAAHYFRFQADTSDKIYLDGAAGNDNGYVGIAAPVVGAVLDFSTFQVAASAWDWIATTISGTWIAG